MAVAPLTGQETGGIRNGLFRLGLAHVVGHLEGNLNRELHLAHVLAVLIPGGLVDKLLHAVLLDGIGVDGGGLKLAEELGTGGLGMTVEKVLSYERFVVGLAVYFNRFLIQVEAFAFAVAHGNGDRQFFKIFLHEKRALWVYKDCQGRGPVGALKEIPFRERKVHKVRGAFSVGTL